MKDEGSLEKETEYKIVSFKQGRFAIANNDKIVDDAQGYGYKDRQRASRAMWYKFKGGREKIDLQKKNLNSWRKKEDNNKIFNKINKLIESYYKEICRGETIIKEIFEEIEKEFEIELPDFVKKEFI